MTKQQLNQTIRTFIGRIVARTLGRTPLTADALTVMSPILMLGAVWLLLNGAFIAAGCTILAVSAFDMLDGALARAKNQVSHFGSFLDSTLDRYSDALIFLGLLLYYQRTSPGGSEIVLIFAGMTGAFFTSYVRARAEGLGYDCRVGWIERPERIVIFVLGLLTNWITPMLWTLAILSHLTALQRLLHVWSQSRTKRAMRAYPHMPE